MRGVFKIFFLLTFFTLLIACQQNVTFNQYQSIEKSQWQNGQVVAFDIPITDTISFYNLFINVRNTNDYEFSNLLLITRMSFPDNKQVIYTLEYEMTNAKGDFLGSGFSEIKENKLFYKEKIRFTKSGNYLFEVKQSMRKRNEIEGMKFLNGVSDVGLSIEKVK